MILRPKTENSASDFKPEQVEKIRKLVFDFIEIHLSSNQILRLIFSDLIKIELLDLLGYPTQKELFDAVVQKFKKENFKLGDMSYCYQLWDAAELDLELGLTVGAIHESVLQTLVPLEKAQRRKVVKYLAAQCGPAKHPTVEQVTEAIKELFPRDLTGKAAKERPTSSD